MPVKEFKSKPSLLHRLDPRIKLLSLVILAFTYSYVSRPVLLGTIVAVTLFLLALSRLSPSYILRKLKLPSFIILTLVITLPFVSGDIVLASLGPLSLKQEGLRSSILIGTRFFCIITTAMIIFNTSPLLDYIKSMRAMKLPWIMADMILLVFRYLQVIGDDYKRMKTSMKIRGFDGNRFNLQTLRTIAWLSGGLLVRSFERSDWIYRSMRIRGYGSKHIQGHDFQAGKTDLAVFAGVILLTGCLAFLEIVLER